MKTRSNRHRGFSLIELMVAVALVAIIMSLAAPSFVTFQRSAELTSRMNGLLAVINAARDQAKNQGSDAVILPKNGDWAQGMTVFVKRYSTTNTDSRTYVPQVDLLVYDSADTLPSYLTYAHSTNSPTLAVPPYIRFGSLGYPKPIGTDSPYFAISLARNDVSGSELYNQTRRLIMNAAGRARVCKPTSGTDLTCLATSSTAATQQ